jgi:hydroxymethylglutaryl-CoA reductase
MSKYISLWQGFSKLNREERFEKLQHAGLLTAEDVLFLKSGGVQSADLAEHCIENALGYFQIPLGVAAHFCIDHREYAIPLAIEETSVIAALSKTAKWIKQHGHITTSQQGTCIIGQIQFPRVEHLENCLAILQQRQAQWVEEVNTRILPAMVKRGGGVREMEFRVIPRADQGQMLVVHVLMDPCDAMGANLINQVLEYLKPLMQQATGEQVHLCILSNLNDQKLTSAKVVMHGINSKEGEAIMEASLFAESDPYRAATHNKGIMNGIDGLLIATGNDWRAVEAGMHAFAATDGQYKALSRWRYVNHQLIGELTAPIVVGTVGGVTALHPTAKLCLAMMNVSSANHLARIAAAVGLVQNLGAIRALASEGIIKGHMRLHIDNILLSVDANVAERSWLKDRLKQNIEAKIPISIRLAEELLMQYRQSQVQS